MIAALLLTTLIELPGELNAFVPKEMEAVIAELGDLNRDGRADYVLVMENAGGERTLLVIVRNADGSLTEATRSAKAVLCRDCGGMMGDPFQGIDIKPGRFTVLHYGGSGWRWSWNFTFAWSKRDRSWQLVRVQEDSFHAGDPEKVEKSVRVPPRDYGLIDLTEFDPENYLGRGKK